MELIRILDWRRRKDALKTTSGSLRERRAGTWVNHFFQ